jgi:hypothetical protein
VAVFSGEWRTRLQCCRFGPSTCHLEPLVEMALLAACPGERWAVFPCSGNLTGTYHLSPLAIEVAWLTDGPGIKW